MNKKYSFCRFICALLIGAMLLSSFAVSSFAEDTGAEKIYYATITNPHDHEVTMPIEIKCGFAEGEVKSADYVHIYDSMDETKPLFLTDMRVRRMPLILKRLTLDFMRIIRLNSEAFG